MTVIQKFFAELLSAYNLGLLFFGKRILAQKLLIKCWWNWHLVMVALHYIILMCVILLSVILLIAILLTAILLSVTSMNVILISVSLICVILVSFVLRNFIADCHSAECHTAYCHFCWVTFCWVSFFVCHFNECHSVECLFMSIALIWVILASAALYNVILMCADVLSVTLLHVVAPLKPSLNKSIINGRIISYKNGASLAFPVIIFYRDSLSSSLLITSDIV